MDVRSLIWVGRVSSVNPSACAARVTFEDRESVVSYELPVIVRGSQDTKDYWLPTPGEQVLCVFVPKGKSADGFIIGSFYSDADPPPVSTPNKRCVVFPDGTRVEYDMSTKKLTVKGDVVIDGNLTVTGTITNGGG